MTTFPTVAVKVSFSTDRYATPSYTTLPASHVTELTTHVGRDSELDTSNPGILEATLRNDTRLYDPTNASGTYYGQLVPGRRTQVTVTYSGVTYQIYNGWTDGWPNQFGTRSGTATLKATGPFGFLQRAVIPDAYQAAILADSPTGYYRMDDAASHTMVDSSGNGRHGHWYPDYVDVKTDKALIHSNDQAVTLPGNPAVQMGKIPATVLPTLKPMSIEFWTDIEKLPLPLTEALYLGNQIFSTIVGPNGGPNIRIHGTTGTYPGAIEFLVVDSPDPTVWHVWSTDNAITDATGQYVWRSVPGGGPMHVVCTCDSVNLVRIWLNGLNVTTAVSTTGTVGAVPAWDMITVNWAAGWDGKVVLDELAFYGAALSGTQVATHYAAGFNPGQGELPGARITRALDLIGWPASLRDLQDGQTVLGTAEFADQKALDYLDVVTATEQGFLSEAHDDSGKVRFQDRAGKLTDVRSTTAQTFFSDQTSDLAGTAVHYAKPVLATDDRPAANIVTVKWMGDEYVAADQPSVDAYGEIPVTVETILEDHEEVVSLADWILTSQSALFTRIKSITLQPSRLTGTPADRAWVAALSRQQGDRVRVVHQPAGTGSTIDQQLYVIGVEHHVQVGIDWETILHLAPAITTTYWLLGTGALGSTSRLSY